MSRALLQSLYASKAFKPAPSLWELAMSHVPLADVGLDGAPEGRVLTALRTGEGVTLLVGRSGAGKSSALAYLADQLSRLPPEAGSGRRYLPVFVPVIGRPGALTLNGFGRGAMREVLDALHKSLSPEHRGKLERGAAREVLTQSSGVTFNAKIGAKLFDAGPETGLQFGQDVTSIIEAEGLDNRGGIKTLGDIVRANGYELVLLVEDTDAWAVGADGGRDQARAFFGTVARNLVSEADVAVGIAVQSHWLTDDRLDEFEQLRSRAVAVPEMPRPTTRAQALTLIEAILDRRIALSIDGEPPPTARMLFSDGALEALAHRVYHSGSVRAALAMVRDTMDRHADALPDRIERPHILDSL